MTKDCDSHIQVRGRMGEELMTDNFEEEKALGIKRIGENVQLQERSNQWMVEASKLNYSYHFTWMGRPIIQFPQDILAMQEIIWETKPDLIIETGVARGGSLIFHASMLELLGGEGDVLGVDIDIREHNRAAIEQHPMSRRIKMIQGSSVDEDVIRQIYDLASGKNRILVVLDSNHTHEHVLKELELYSPLIKKGGYLIVLDTVVEDFPEDFYPDRPWGRGNNPKTALRSFLAKNDRFVVDGATNDKLLISVAPGGYLKCIKD